jgi:hypothetical protein
MPVFKKLELNDIKTIKPYFALSKSRACDNTVGGTFIWRDFFGMEYAAHKENFIFKGKFENNATVFAMPLGKNEAEIFGSLKQIEYYCRENGLPMIICLATGGDMEIISNLYEKTEITFENGWSDYLYKASDLADLGGRKYSGQRNHINYFKRAYENFDIKQITPKTIGDVRAFFEKYIQKNEIYYKNSPVLTEESKKIFEIFDNFEIYGQTGIILYINNAVIGFAIGETVFDTLFVHIEKADPDFRGAYQMLVNGFAKLYADENIEYINREDDAGDENLRISKLSYHPCDIIKKYTVKINL